MYEAAGSAEHAHTTKNTSARHDQLTTSSVQPTECSLKRNRPVVGPVRLARMTVRALPSSVPAVEWACYDGEMRVLVSTKKMQKQRENDFCFVPENELLFFGLQCSGEKVDGSCGCRRSLCGVKCLKATTTMKVASSKLDEEGLAEAIHRAWKKGGWVSSLEDKRARGRARKMAKEISSIAKKHRVGTILERRATFAKRRAPTQRVKRATPRARG